MIFPSVLLVFPLFLQLCRGIELTFELPDNAVECFYEDMKSGVENVLEYQVCIHFALVILLLKLYRS